MAEDPFWRRKKVREAEAQRAVKRGVGLSDARLLTQGQAGLSLLAGTILQGTSIMRLLAACLFSIALALPVAAQEEPIQQTIQNQLDAFQADDFARAFTFASPNIKGIFGTPDNFGAMVSQGYPMVRSPSAVTMLELREVAGNLWQRVMITDEAGRTHLLDYQMIETAEGWQINGVQLLRAPDVGA
jgi:Domain of unknown function (DUF4864)